ncbi:Rho guanine nucleotide exchange factor 15, partial [Ophiophagus hannah]
MSSLDPLPPATPPSQKPTRIIKPRPPTRPRPYLPPRPDSAKLLRVPTPPLPLEKDGCSLATEHSGGPPQPLHKLQKSGAVRKIVVHFDQTGPLEKEEAEKITRSLPSSCQKDEKKEEKAIGEKEIPDQLGGAKWTGFSHFLPNPGMVLVWVPATSRLQDTENGLAADLSSSADEGGASFQKFLGLGAQPAQPSSTAAGRVPKSRRSSRSKKPLDSPPSTNGHPEGGVVLTSYRSTAEPLPLRCPPLMPKPPRRNKGGASVSLDGELQPPAIPPKAPMKPPRSSLGPTARRSSLQYPLELNHLLGRVAAKMKRAVSASQRRTNQTTGTLRCYQLRVRTGGFACRTSLFEVVTSEASYLRSLALLIEHFMESRELAGSILLREHRILFSNIRKVQEVSERFLQDLERRLAESLQISDVCDIVEDHAQQSFSVYIDYVRNQLYQEKTYSSLMEKNAQFAIVVTRLQEQPQCQRLPFMSFLLLPFQRITRIKMLLENILRRTEEASLREQNALKALASVSKIIEECNSEVGRMRHMEELIHTASKIEFDKLKAIPIISQTRQLLKQGELLEVVHRGTIFGNKPKLIPIYLFLFNDLLLVTQRKSSERFVVLDYAHRSLVQAQSCEDTSAGQNAENSFYLTLMENHQGRSSERLCRAPTQSDMHRWMGAFPCHESQPNNKQETIYEDWDCPQVQCTETYSAAQADELSLEPTDIVNVVRKTEGWYEGIRLADGKKGWFPSCYVQEITNEHVRRRNLRERYRVLQVARQLQLMRTNCVKSKYSSA